MDLRARLINHHRRWNIEFDDEEQFTQLKNRVMSIVDRIVGNWFAENPRLDRKLAEQLGASVKILESSTEPAPIQQTMSQFQGRKKTKFGATHLYRTLEKSDNLERLVTVLQVMFWLLEQHGLSKQIQELANDLRANVKLTPSVEFQIVRRGEKVTLYPPGDQLLDEKTVNEPLSWMENYPKAAEPFERALRLHQDGDSSRNRNLLDNLRFAIEQLLREVLGNERNLENQKEQLLKWMGENRLVHQQVVKMYEQLLFGSYRIYQNEAVKHSEDCSEEEVEFMIYLTGTFMRLLIQLSDSSRAPVED